MFRHVAVTLGMAVVSLSSHADITTGLLGYYPLDGDATDASGTARNGNASNITYTTGRLGQAAVFNNVDGVITVNALANVLPGGNTARSVGFWMYLTSAGSNGNMVTWGASANSRRFSVLEETTRELRVIGEFNDASSGYIIPANTWTHVVVTYDATSLRFYVNGTLVNSQASPAYNTDASMPLRIGANVGNNEFFGGQLDEVRVYNRVLTAGDVSQLYAYSGVTTVPTLADWSKAAMAAMLLGAGALYVRRRNASQS